MPANESIPFYEPGHTFTGKCTAPVTGSRFVVISGNKDADTGAVSIAPAGAGARVFGVAAYDGAIDALVPVHSTPGMVVAVTSAAALAAGAPVASDATGRVVAAGAAGTPIAGYLIDAVTNGGTAKVRLLPSVA